MPKKKDKSERQNTSEQIMDRERGRERETRYKEAINDDKHDDSGSVEKLTPESASEIESGNKATRHPHILQLIESFARLPASSPYKVPRSQFLSSTHPIQY
jgi:hypothetical protein